jgi:sRNA-binding carbon storage regulator CsrA
MTQALLHPYVAQFHDREEPTCPNAIRISIDDNKKCGTTEYRNELYADIKKKKKEQKKAAKKKREKKKGSKKRREKKEKD